MKYGMNLFCVESGEGQSRKRKTISAMKSSSVGPSIETSADH